VADKDSVFLWHRPLKADSLQVHVTRENYTENFTIRTKAQKNDTLSFNARQSGNLSFRDDFIIAASRPLTAVNNELIRLTGKDSTAAVPFTSAYDPYLMELRIKFEKQPLEKYKMTLLPGALTDYLEVKNDSLKFQFSTKNTSDFGNLKLTLSNVRKFPIIVELVDSKGELKASAYSDSSNIVEFIALEPALYTLRVIYDDNANKQWDTGSFLEKRQPEEVIYYPTTLDVRANWDVDQTFTLP
jgi:hypothetical protein